MLKNLSLKTLLPRGGAFLILFSVFFLHCDDGGGGNSSDTWLILSFPDNNSVGGRNTERCWVTPDWFSNPTIFDGAKTFDLKGDDSRKYYCKVEVGPGHGFAKKTFYMTERQYGYRVRIEAPENEMVTAVVTFYEACNSCTYYASGRTKFTGSALITAGQTRYVYLEAALGGRFVQCNQ